MNVKVLLKYALKKFPKKPDVSKMLPLLEWFESNSNH